MRTAATAALTAGAPVALANKRAPRGGRGLPRPRGGRACVHRPTRHPAHARPSTGLGETAEAKPRRGGATHLAAWALKKHWQIATSLGDAEVRTGRHRDAAEHFAYALREGAEMSPAQREGVQRALDEARKQIATIDLQIAPDGADVVVDGAFVGRSPLADPVFLAPGEHALEVKKVGFVAKSEKVTASAGAASTLRVELVEEGTMGHAMPPPPGTATPMQPPSDEVDDGPGVAPWILIGGGAAVAIGGGVLLGVGLSEQSSGSELKDRILADGGACEPASPGFETRCDDAFGSESTGNTLAGVGTALLVTGGAAMVGGLVWMLVAPDGAAEHGVVVAPVMSHESAGLGAWGRF